LFGYLEIYIKVLLKFKKKGFSNLMFEKPEEHHTPLSLYMSVKSTHKIQKKGLH